MSYCSSPISWQIYARLGKAMSEVVRFTSATSSSDASKITDPQEAWSAWNLRRVEGRMSQHLFHWLFPSYWFFCCQWSIWFHSYCQLFPFQFRLSTTSSSYSSLSRIETCDCHLHPLHTCSWLRAWSDHLRYLESYLALSSFAGQ